MKPCAASVDLHQSRRTTVTFPNSVRGIAGSVRKHCWPRGYCIELNRANLTIPAFMAIKEINYMESATHHQHT